VLPADRGTGNLKLIVTELLLFAVLESCV